MILKKFLAFLNFITNTPLEQKSNFYLENLW
ncbi:hypothetical protein L934_09420 [Helicobacter pylori PZ5080]|uniref:Uncharacterized protein n=1 Tax=Helicobacter pylori PZ5080 TaxID=1337394 RepID=T2SJU3_HELPX|nr:hypothetical protein L934_09420 [Helicobacter pylori PZ5080]